LIASIITAPQSKLHHARVRSLKLRQKSRITMATVRVPIDNDSASVVTFHQARFRSIKTVHDNDSDGDER